MVAASKERFPLEPWRRSFALLMLFALFACQSSSPNRDQPDEQAQSQDAELIDTAEVLLGEMIEEKSRLLDFQYTLNVARVRSCKKMARPQYGVLTGNAERMDDAWLREASQRNGMSGNMLTILHVVPGSAFSRAGLRPGDGLLEINGERPASNSEFNRVRLGTTDLSITDLKTVREGEEKEFVIPVVPGCPISFVLSQSEQLFTFSKGPLVYVPRGLMAYGQDDDLLGVALAHGMAHALYLRRPRLSLDDERRADLLGMEIAAQAHFDTNRAIQYWEDVAKVYPHLIFPEKRNRRIDENFMEELISGTMLGGHHDLSNRMALIREHARRLNPALQ